MRRLSHLQHVHLGLLEVLLEGAPVSSALLEDMATSGRWTFDLFEKTRILSKLFERKLPRLRSVYALERLYRELQDDAESCSCFDRIRLPAAPFHLHCGFAGVEPLQTVGDLIREGIVMRNCLQDCPQIWDDGTKGLLFFWRLRGEARLTLLMARCRGAG